MPKKKKVKDPCQQIYDELTHDALEQVRSHRRPVQRIRASEVSNCARQIWYRLSGARPAPRDAAGNMFGICGDNDHDLTRSMMLHFGIPVDGITVDKVTGKQEEDQTRVRIYDTTGPDGEPIQVTFSSRGDGILPETPRGRCLLEIKGISKWVYKYWNEKFEEGGHGGAEKYMHDKKRKYVWQMEVTMHLFGEEQAYLMVKERDTGTLGFWDKSDDSHSGVYMLSDEERWNTILKHAAYIMHCLKHDMAPVREYTAKSTECKQCSFKYLCHDKDDRVAKKKAGKLSKDAPDVIYPGPQIDIHE